MSGRRRGNAPAVEESDQAAVEATDTEISTTEGSTEISITEGSTEGNPTQVTNQAEAGTEAGTEQVEASTAEPVLDLGPFKTAVSTAVAHRDTETGIVADEHLRPPVAAYAELKGTKAKGAAKRWLAEQMARLLNDLDAVQARAFMVIQNALITTPGTQPRPPADPAEAYVQNYAVLLAAVGHLEGIPPVGISEDWPDQVNTLKARLLGDVARYSAWETSTDKDKGEAPKVDALAVRAYRLAAGRPSPARRTSTSTGPRSPRVGGTRSVETHIQEAFADLEEGDSLTVQQIVNFRSAEYGDDAPSSGAVSARLFPRSGNCTLKGVEPVADLNGKRGARKVAA
jgi:hypothetical protein